jgi:hypothetical protein
MNNLFKHLPFTNQNANSFELNFYLIDADVMLSNPKRVLCLRMLMNFLDVLLFNIDENDGGGLWFIALTLPYLSYPTLA